MWKPAIAVIVVIATAALAWALYSRRTTRSADVPRLAKFVAPVYPPLARQAGVQGEVRVAAHVDSNCQVAKIDFRGSAPLGPSSTTNDNGQILLRAAAEDAIKRWHFSSCKGDLSPVAINVRFILAGEKTDGWAPTEVTLSSPLTVEITTEPYKWWSQVP